jgi:hypothetical protein
VTTVRTAWEWDRGLPSSQAPGRASNQPGNGKSPRGSEIDQVARPDVLQRAEKGVAVSCDAAKYSCGSPREAGKGKPIFQCSRFPISRCAHFPRFLALTIASGVAMGRNSRAERCHSEQRHKRQITGRLGHPYAGVRPLLCRALVIARCGRRRLCLLCGVGLRLRSRLTSLIRLLARRRSLLGHQEHRQGDRAKNAKSTESVVRFIPSIPPLRQI